MVQSRIQHYKFAHKVLKDAFFEDRVSLVETILNSEDDLRGLWYAVGKYYAEHYEGIEELDGSDLSIVVKEFEDKFFIMIQMPIPIESPEAYFVGLVIPLKNINEARYITLEYGEEDNFKYTVLCEWTEDTHLNLGEGCEPTMVHFKDTLIGLGYTYTS